MLPRLDLLVERASEVPVGTQLAWQLRTLIATGVLQPRARLPGIREVADSAGVNVNTVRSVFARLEEQGLLVSEQGRGTFVAASAGLDARLAETTQAMIVKAHESGIDPRDLAAALYVAPTVSPHAIRVPDSQKEPAPPALAARDRAEKGVLYEQIERLEHEIGRLEPLGTLEQSPSSSEPRILTAAELRKVRDDLARRLDGLRRERGQWRTENEHLRRAQRAADEGDDRAAPWATGTRRWRAGIWTGHSPQVSWTRS